MTLLRAMDPKVRRLTPSIYCAPSTRDHGRIWIVDGRSAVKVEGKIAVGDIVSPTE